MGTISAAFTLISGALDADQSALSVVANNVANANTPGYTQERPKWQENDPVTINGIQYGAGVSQNGATSARDRILAERLNQQQQLGQQALAGFDGEPDVVADAGLERQPAGQERGVRRQRLRRVRVRSLEHNAVRRERVDGRRLHALVAVRRQMIRAQRVDRDEDNGPAGRR